MGFLIDFIVIAIFILNIMVGYKKGLVNVVFNILAFFIAIIVTLILFKPVSNYIVNNTDLDNQIRQAIIDKAAGEEKKSLEKEEATSLEQYINNTIKNAENKAKDDAILVIADNVSAKAVDIITAIGLFIVIRIVLNLLKFLLESISDIPIIKQFNKAGGIVYGAAKALVLIYLVLTILFFVVSTKNNGIVANMIEESYVTKLLYNNNILINYCLLGKNLL